MMATQTVLNSHRQSLLHEYSAFWQLWPQYEQANGERRLAGFEIELIGFHPSELNHLDLGCPKCRNVRAVLFTIANLLRDEASQGENCVTYDVDTHANSILCLPALGNRSAVTVSVYVSWSPSDVHSSETRLFNEIKTFLSVQGIYQR